MGLFNTYQCVVFNGKSSWQTSPALERTKNSILYILCILSSYYSLASISISTPQEQEPCLTHLCATCPSASWMKNEWIFSPWKMNPSMHIVKKRLFLIPKLYLRMKGKKTKQSRTGLLKELLASIPEFTILDYIPLSRSDGKPTASVTYRDASKPRARQWRPDATKGTAKSRIKEKPVEWCPKQHYNLWVFSIRGPTASIFQQIYCWIC